MSSLHQDRLLVEGSDPVTGTVTTLPTARGTSRRAVGASGEKAPSKVPTQRQGKAQRTGTSQSPASAPAASRATRASGASGAEATVGGTLAARAKAATVKVATAKAATAKAATAKAATAARTAAVLTVANHTASVRSVRAAAAANAAARKPAVKAPAAAKASNAAKPAAAKPSTPAATKPATAKVAPAPEAAAAAKATPVVKPADAKPAAAAKPAADAKPAATPAAAARVPAAKPAAATKPAAKSAAAAKTAEAKPAAKSAAAAKTAEAKPAGKTAAAAKTADAKPAAKPAAATKVATAKTSAQSRKSTAAGADAIARVRPTPYKRVTAADAAPSGQVPLVDVADLGVAAAEDVVVRRDTPADPARTSAPGGRLPLFSRRRTPFARRRPAVYLAAALVGAISLTPLAPEEPTAQATSTVSQSVSVAEQLGIEANATDVVVDAEATERLGELAASRTARDAEQAAAAQVQAEADRIAAEAAVEAARPKAVMPVNGARLTSAFGARWGTLHAGIDLAAPMHTPEYAVMDGVVLEAGPASGYGLAVYIQHENGDVTVYGHMDEILVQAGQVVRAGDTIALLGNRGQSTGPHLHFEVHVGGLDGQKIDPLPWLRDKGVNI